jgi:hypothetical protein
MVVSGQLPVPASLPPHRSLQYSFWAPDPNRTPVVQPVRGLVTKFEVLTAEVMKSTIFWDITPGSPLNINRRFGGTYRLHLQDLFAACFHAGFLLCLFFDSDDGDDMFL